MEKGQKVMYMYVEWLPHNVCQYGYVVCTKFGRVFRDLGSITAVHFGHDMLPTKVETNQLTKMI